MQKQAMTLVATIRFHIHATLTTGLIGEEVNAMKIEKKLLNETKVLQASLFIGLAEEE